MRTLVPLTGKQLKAGLRYKPNVGKIYRALDWLRDSVLDENREEFARALTDLRFYLAELDEKFSSECESVRAN
jgi:hypothetical protein